VIRRLLLWDIDGTLIRAGMLGAEVFDRAIRDVVGIEPATRPRMSGKTDPQIVREYLDLLGIAEAEDTVPDVLERLAFHLASSAHELPLSGAACPGAATVLQRMANDPAVISTALTGNIAPNAVVKLTAFDLARWLDLAVGAYGSDDADRLVLVPIAMRRAAELRQARLEPDQVWVIGDTPRDLACARAAGVHCLLVGTGRTPADELVKYGPDAVLDDLSDTETVVKLLAGG
jgi:phosphoglycolate phosphatase-like HAD superfamily hydrolase